MIQSFGPEARGSSCSATLAMSETEVLYPYVRHPDVLAAMSSEGFELYKDELKDDGVLIYESNLVHPVVKPTQRAYGIPSTRIAEMLGRVLVQNVVMLGFFSAITKLVPLLDLARFDCAAGVDRSRKRPRPPGRAFRGPWRGVWLRRGSPPPPPGDRAGIADHPARIRLHCCIAAAAACV